MPKEKEKISKRDKLIWGYRLMIERVFNSLSAMEKKASPSVKKALEMARLSSVELGELTHEESEKVVTYLERDLVDAAEYVDATGKAVKDWLAFDWMLIEDQLWTLFSGVADKTYLEMVSFKQELNKKSGGQYLVDEVTGAGTLKCGHCGELQHFHKIDNIKVCPKCKGSVFTRIGNNKT